ncbi:MAG: rane-bound lytic murein transglycosylase [Desulfovibrionales bacterium]|jgi:membrane-bound lytic murein transglycosylase A|nr:rane-bound lytic murein transglycosylase [Desulfovibrionales bacterium]
MWRLRSARTRGGAGLYALAVLAGLALVWAGCVHRGPVRPSDAAGTAFESLKLQAPSLPGETADSEERALRLFEAPAMGDGQGWVEVPAESAELVLGQISPSTQGLRSWMDLAGPLSKSLDYVQFQDPAGKVLELGGAPLTYGQMELTLRQLLWLLPRLDAHQDILHRYFRVFALRPAPVVTGYFTPEIEVSREARPGYEHPLYRKPPDLKQITRGRKTVVGRIEKGRFLPYYDRKTIEEGQVLSGKGLEIAWAKDPVDVCCLHMQGAGSLKFPDGARMFAEYDGSNGLAFTGLGATLLAGGHLPPGRLTWRFMRDYFKENPEKRALLNRNRRYIFFQLEKEGPKGSMNSALTPQVSLAVDPSVIPLGAVLAFGLRTVSTDLGADGAAGGFKLVRGLGLAQDLGAVIKGHRMDFYAGAGDDAQYVAGRLKTPAAAYLLVSRDALRR